MKSRRYGALLVWLTLLSQLWVVAAASGIEAGLYPSDSHMASSAHEGPMAEHHCCKENGSMDSCHMVGDCQCDSIGCSVHPAMASCQILVSPPVVYLKIDPRTRFSHSSPQYPLYRPPIV